MSGNKALIRTMSTYTVANLLNAAIPFLLLPFLTTFLSKEDYGIVAMFQVLISFTQPFIGMNMESAIGRQYFEKQINIRSYVTNALYLIIISTTIVSLVFIGAGGLISRFTSFPSSWLWIVILCSFSQALSEIILTLWQVRYKAVNYALFRIIRTVLDIGLSVILVVVFRKTWDGRIEGQVIAVVIFAVLTIFFIVKEGWISPTVNKAYIKNALAFGLPLIPHVVGAVVMTMADRVFITNMVGLAATGLYAVGYQVGMLIALLQNSFNQAWIPWFYEKLKENNRETDKRIVKITYYYNVIILACALLLALCAPIIFKYLIGKDYYSAYGIVIWIALGFAFNGMYKMVVNYLFFLQKTWVVSVATLLTAGISFLLNYLLIGIYGATGAAMATTISFFLQFVAIWIISARIYKMPWLYFIKK
jgi:O-antigen/teichoic acid export membrane protein